MVAFISRIDLKTQPRFGVISLQAVGRTPGRQNLGSVRGGERVDILVYPAPDAAVKFI